MTLKTSTLVTTFITGMIASLLFLLMFYAVFGQILVDFVIGEFSSSMILLTIIIGLLLITAVVSLAVGFLTIKGIEEVIVLT